LYIDLHAHTYPASDDSFISADDLIDGAKQAGLDGICLTEHDHFWVPDDVERLAKRHDFLVLAGAEINTEDGHVLVFGLHQYQFGMHKASFLGQQVREAGGAMVAAHPFRRRYPRSKLASAQEVAEALQKASGEELFATCSAIEVVNGRGSSEENLFSKTLCDRLGLAGTGGSDIHRAEHIGRACTKFHHKVSSLGDLVRELNSGACEAELGYAS
jgi:predicted metal-dependent phosphoesterase TrpH